MEKYCISRIYILNFIDVHCFGCLLCITNSKSGCKLKSDFRLTRDLYIYSIYSLEERKHNPNKFDVYCERMGEAVTDTTTTTTNPEGDSKQQMWLGHKLSCVYLNSLKTTRTVPPNDRPLSMSWKSTPVSIPCLYKIS